MIFLKYQTVYWNEWGERRWRNEGTNQEIWQTKAVSSVGDTPFANCPLPWQLMTRFNFCNPAMYFSPELRQVSNSLFQPMSFGTSAIRGDFSTLWLNRVREFRIHHRMPETLPKHHATLKLVQINDGSPSYTLGNIHTWPTPHPGPWNDPIPLTASL